jgi:F-type H+-transporting ATPase subunit alpha
MQFGSDVDDSTKAALDSGRRLTEILKQGRFAPVADALQTVLIYAVNEGFAKNIAAEDMERFEKELYIYLAKECASLLQAVEAAKKLDQPLKESLNSAITEFVERF